MLLYYQSWMFYNHSIVILYHFLVLTYWHSAQCQLVFSECFLHHRKSISNGVQMQRNSWRIFWVRRKPMGQGSTWGAARGEQHPPGRARRARRALVGAAHLGCPLNRLFALYSGNPRGVSENQFHPPQSPKPPDPIYTPSRRGSPLPLVPLRWCVSSSL